MKIMLKHTLKNIAAKPLRAILLFVCIGVCSFTAFLCLDMSKTIENLVKYMFMQVTGTADIVMTDSMGLEEGMLQTEEASVGLRVASRQSGTIEVPEGFVSFFHTKHFEVKTMDFERAYQMRLLGEKLSLSKDQAAISKKLSKEYGLKKGDTIALYDDTGKEESYHVVKVLSESGMVNGVQTVLLGEEGYQKLLYGGEMLYDTAYIDVLDDSFSGQVAEELEKKDFRADVKVLFDEGEMKNMIRMITMVFLLMFAVCFLLVIFVTVSVSGRVISERMPVVGTFRSLGISNTLTTSFLLLESGIYGLLGGALGCLLYRFFRNLIFSKIVSVDAGDVSVPEKMKKTLADLEKYLSSGKRILIRYEGEDVVLPVKNIIYAEAQNNSVEIVLTGQIYRIRKKLSVFEKELSEVSGDFFRVHRGYLINLKHVKKSLGKEVILTGDVSVPVSRSLSKEFKERLFQYVRESAR